MLIGDAYWWLMCVWESAASTPCRLALCTNLFSTMNQWLNLEHLLVRGLRTSFAVRHYSTPLLLIFLLRLFYGGHHWASQFCKRGGVH